MGTKQRNDPTPLSFAQMKALAVAAGRELFWALAEVKRDARRWQQHAARIPSQPLRVDASRALDRKRGNVVGAALFSTLPRRRNKDVLHTLATFQTIFDFLDNVHERHPELINGVELNSALIDALDPHRPCADYYQHHPWKDDGGYLIRLVEDCRNACQGLPSYEQVRPLLIREATRAQHVLALNHIPVPAQRDIAIRQWVEVEFPEEAGWSWFELSAAASGQLAIFALLALAAEPDLTDQEIADGFDVYWPRLPLVATMLDSYVDQSEDEANGTHLYISHYPSSDRAVTRVSELSSEAAERILALPNGHRHAVVMSCMVTFYLSKSSARTSALRSSTQQLVRANGTLARVLMPILRAWRIAYSQSSA